MVHGDGVLDGSVQRDEVVKTSPGHQLEQAVAPDHQAQPLRITTHIQEADDHLPQASRVDRSEAVDVDHDQPGRS